MFKRVAREELKVPAEVDYLGDLRDFVTKVGRKFGVSESIINAFKLAIDEAGTNIIRHAYRDWQGFITLRMIVREQTVTISLIDQGHAFDPRNAKDPDLQRYVDIGKKGGLGVFIIRRVIDDIDYRKTEEGNELRLTKDRDSSKRHKLMVPEIPFNMKTKFFITATAVLSPLIIAAFLYQFLGVQGRITRGELEEGWGIARVAAHRSADYLLDEAHWELATISKEFHDNYAPRVWDAVIVNTAGIIQGEHQLERLFKPFVVPANAEPVEAGVKTYALTDGRRVYDLIAEIDGPQVGQVVGAVHILLDRTVIDAAIGEAKSKLIVTYIMVLIFGNLGAGLLIYLTMSPFRKLASWVKDMGQGGSPDEMDFDAGDEVGEIAKAFNEITEKFRKSQENLAEQERLQKEMQVAQEIQQTLLPDKFPDIEGYELASYYEAAKEVGGDYFDFVEVDKDTLGIVVADVSGKGVPGSLVMTMIRTALRTEARGNKNAADVLARVNEFVMNDMKRGMFVTVFYIILDSKKRTINYASAGHNPMILFRGSTRKSYYLNPRGFPIGISLPDKSLFRNSIESDTLRLKQDDVLLAFTDGVTEAMNERRDLFGDERFLEAIRRHGHLGAEPLVDRLHGELDVFTEGSQQNDDITLVAIREKMNAEDVIYNHRQRLINRVVVDGLSVKAACEEAGVSTSTYYKYKKRFDKDGETGLRDKTVRSEIEEKHISIEDKAKIIDIVRKNPELGGKRISEELATDVYDNTIIDSGRIYDELVRSKLNTRELREAFLEKGQRSRFKQAGTPMLTLDGQVVKEVKSSLPSFPLDEEEEDVFTSDHNETDESVSDLPEAVAGAEEVDSILEEFLGVGEEELDFTESFEKDSVYSDSVSVEVPPESESTEDTAEFSEELTREFSEVADTAIESGVDMMDLSDSDSDIGEFGALLSVDDALDELEDETTQLDSPVLDEEAVVSNDDGAETSDANHWDLMDLEASEEWDDVVADAAEVLDDAQDDEDDDSIDMQLDEVLAIDEDGELFIEIEGNAHIEEKIASSSLDDLLSEFSSDDERENDIEQPTDQDTFVDLMEELGFDRRNMLASTDELAEETLVVAQPMLDTQRIFSGGMSHYQTGQYHEAIREFERVLEIDPRDGSAYQCLGDAHFRLGEMMEARSAYEEARQLLPENVSVLENLGVIFANMGEYKKAVWQWGEILKRDPERKDIIERIKKMQRMIRQRYL